MSKSMTLLFCFLFISPTSIGQTTSSSGSEILYGNNEKAGRYVQSGDARIYYELYGKGKPIVLLHGGIMGSIAEMHDFIDRFSKEYQVIAISTRGHGKSEIGKGPITYEQKANDIIAVINAVTNDSVILLGFSDGAYTGYKVASMYPNKVRKLIAIGAGEQVPGLRKVVFDSKTFDIDNDFWKSRLALMQEPKRFPEFLKMMETFYKV